MPTRAFCLPTAAAGGPLSHTHWQPADSEGSRVGAAVVRLHWLAPGLITERRLPAAASNRAGWQSWMLQVVSGVCETAARPATTVASAAAERAVINVIAVTAPAR